MKKEKIEAQASKEIKKAAKAEVTNQKKATPIILPIQEEIAKKKTKKEKAQKNKKKEAKVIKEVAAQQKESIIEEVISRREVKYIYPADVTDTLAKKTWRQKTRNELHKLELAVARIKDTNSKEYKKALKEYNDYKAKVLKPDQVA